MGLGQSSPIVHTIDFGLAKKYRNSQTGVHIRFGEKKSLTGTVRYASANAHRFYELSRRDDLESIGNLAIYFFNGKLPWQDINEQTKSNKFVEISRIKTSISLKELCKNCPVEIFDYMTYVRNLKFEEDPDFNYMF